MEAEYTIYELIEELKKDETIGDDPEFQAYCADQIYMMIGY